MATSDQVTVDIPPQMDQLHEIENELVTSTQEHNVMNTTITSQHQLSHEEIVEIRTSPPQDQDERINIAQENEEHEKMDEHVTSPLPEWIAVSKNESSDEIIENDTSVPHEGQFEIERRNRHFKLYVAALNGDWNTAERIYKKDNIDISVKLSKDGDTALHIAATGGRHTGFVKKLLEQMNKEDLAVKNNAGNTAIFLAAASKRVEIVKAMIEKNEDIVKIRGDSDMFPLHKAALMGDKETVEYLYDATGDELLDDNDRFELLLNLINNGLYDVALDLVERHPQTARARDKNEETALHLLARMPVLTRTFNSHPIRICTTSAIYLYNEVKRDVIERCHSVFGRQRVKKTNELSLRDRMNERQQLMNERKQRGRKRLGWVAQIKEAIDKANYTGQEIPNSAFELVQCL